MVGRQEEVGTPEDGEKVGSRMSAVGPPEMPKYM